MGFVWWVFWQRGAARSPELHPRISAEELQLIRGADGAGEETPAPALRLLLRTPAVWAIIFCHFCTNWGTYVLLAWMPTSPFSPMIFRSAL